MPPCSNSQYRNSSLLSCQGDTKVVYEMFNFVIRKLHNDRESLQRSKLIFHQWTMTIGTLDSTLQESRRICFVLQSHFVGEHCIQEIRLWLVSQIITLRWLEWTRDSGGSLIEDFPRIKLMTLTHKNGERKCVKETKFGTQCHNG